MARTTTVDSRLFQFAFRRWFVGGETNPGYNAVDRHLEERGEQSALATDSTGTNLTREISRSELHREANAFAAIPKKFDAGCGDCVVIRMPNMAEAAFAMRGCIRIGAMHPLVFGGFAVHSLALGIDDARYAGVGGGTPV